MKTTSIYRRRLALLGFLFYCLLSVNFAFSQPCPVPNEGFSVGSTDALCLGSGSVTVSGVTGGSNSYEYQLVNPTNSGLNKPWQTSNVFTSVSSGSYQVEVRSTCTSGENIYSSVITQTVIVGGNYETLSLSVNTTPTCSIDGTITTTASKGYLAPSNGYRYALVPSLNEPEPISSYVRPQQPSNIFTGLAPGTYYVRVYDDCSDFASYRTIQAIVEDNTIAPPPITVNRGLSDCNSEYFTVSLGANPVPPGTFTFVFPDGSREVLTLTEYSVLTIPVTFAKFGSPGPDNDFYIEYADPCGNITLSPPYYYDEVQRELVLGSTIAETCSTSVVTPYLRFYSQNWPNGSPQIGSFTFTYSIDGGPTQVYILTDWGPNFTFPNDGGTHSITVTVCGITETFLWTAPTPHTELGLRITERNSNSCEGNSGMAIMKIGGGTGTLSFHFTSVPFGQTVPSDQSVPYLVLNNLLPGSYSFTVTDGCLVENRTFVLTHPLQHTIEVTEGVRCDEGQSGIDINITANYYTAPENTVSQFPQTYTAWVYDLSNNLITSETFPTVTDFLSPQSLSEHLVLNPGTYKIVVGKTPDCTLYERNITIPGNQPITLNQLLATSFCPTEGFTVVQASGGVGPYQYTLYENAIAVPNKLAGPQPGNAFTGLDHDKTYFVAATDECGAGINIQTQFSTVPITTALNSESSDCLGEAVQLEVYSLPGATYQWYKDNLPIPGATQAVYQIPVLGNSDLGIYKVDVTLGTCSDNTTDLELKGLNCSPFPVRISSFSAKREGTIALITWSTSFEENSDHFEVQHSANGRTWQTAGRVLSKGVALSANSYTFNHTSPLNGNNYYRLKMVDKDGSFAYSPIRSVRFNLGIDAELLVYPNPAIDRVTIKSSDTTPVSSVTVYNMAGVKLLSTSVSKDGTVNLSRLPAGSYILKISYVTGAFTTEKIKLLP
jgi:hypothetical protein